jgi:hypothetical protein
MAQLVEKRLAVVTIHMFSEQYYWYCRGGMEVLR